MKVITFNVNGIRARLHQLDYLIKKHAPEIICLQEIKATDDVFPFDTLSEMGYTAYTFGQKAHYGVAFLAKIPPLEVVRGFSRDDEQKRLIVATFKYRDSELTIFNGYFPQGESRDHPTKFPAKEKFYADLLNLLKTNYNPKSNILVVGDMNVAPADLDVGIGEKNAQRWLNTGKCCFLPEERLWLSELMDWGLVDIFRNFNKNDKNNLSWFDYRSKGFDDSPPRGLRIDLILATEPLALNCLETAIDYEIRGMEKPSDHAPVWATFK